MIRVLATTGCRSDFDLLSTVYQRLAGDARFAFGLLVAGAHLSERFGWTVANIEATGLPIVAKIDSFVDSDALDARPRSAAEWILKAHSVVRQFQPDVILACGDREDSLSACVLGAYMRVPVAHFFGGDHGQTRDVDNLVRHACSKLASLHFVAMPEHRDRLLAMGEPADRIYVVGNPALDGFRATPVMTRSTLWERISAHGMDDRPYAVVIHHPTFADIDAGAEELDRILRELVRRELGVFVGFPNVDSGSRSMIEVIVRWKQSGRIHPYSSLPRSEFVNLMRHASVLVGNSSMGLLEAPSVPLPVVNVGSRQRGRTATSNVVFVDSDEAAIRLGLDIALSEEFLKSLLGMENPYGDGRSAERIVEILGRGIDSELTDKLFDPLALSSPRTGKMLS